jgi:hypothetical protein
MPVGDIDSSDLEKLEKMFDTLMVNLRRNSKRRVYNYAQTGLVEYDEFYPSKSKEEIDPIDKTLGEHFGFNAQELDHIINFDIKYRMGQGMEDNDD